MKRPTKIGVGMLTLLSILAVSSIAEARLIKAFEHKGRVFEWMPPPRRSLIVRYSEFQYKFPQTWRNIFVKSFNRYKSRYPGLSLSFYSDGNPDTKKYMRGNVARATSPGSPTALATVLFMDDDSASNQGNLRSPDSFLLRVRNKPFDRQWWVRGGSVPRSHYDLESTFVHELGHVLGVAHPTATEANKHCRGAREFQATMCPNLLPGSNYMRTPIRFDYAEVGKSLKRPAFTDPPPPGCAPGCCAPPGCALEPGTKVASQITEWVDPPKDIWQKRADHVFVGKVMSVSDSFRNSEVELPQWGEVSDKEFDELVAGYGYIYLRYQLKVIKPYKGAKAGETITVTTLAEDDFKLKVGEDLLFFTTKSTLDMFDAKGRSRVQPSVEFVWSPRSSVFKPANGNARSATKFKNRYRSFSEQELLNFGRSPQDSK